jgi:hypothetical protein
MCIEFQKGRMNIREAKRNLTELIDTVDPEDRERVKHLRELYMSDDLEAELKKHKEKDDE